MPALDETRALRDESRRVVAALQARYAEETGARTLRIKHNNFLGYFIEVPQAVGEELVKPPLQRALHPSPDDAGRDALLDGGAGATSRAGSPRPATRALALELEYFDRLCAEAVGRDDRDQGRGGRACAGRRRRRAGGTRGCWRMGAPASSTTACASCCEAGRHPVVEAALKRDGQPFVANDADLSAPAGGKGGRIALITGPNMAGKSTYLRQNAIIAVLAQMGSFVPARRAHLGVVDRLFSRVGAADDLARGRSTFMVEMIETAAILNQATPRSLVILDEIGRGTATFDGLSIAWAAIEHLHEANRCRAALRDAFPRADRARRGGCRAS